MWYDNEISRGIMTKKYLHEGEEPSAFLPRVASIFSPKLRGRALKALENADFLPAGRTLFGAGYKGERKVSMSNCFLAGTKVATRRGLLNIEDVIDGDEVMTSNGYRVVNAVMSREFNGDLFKLKGCGLYDDIMCTPNHRFLTNKGWTRADRLFKGSLLMATPNYEIAKKYDDIDFGTYFISDDKNRLAVTSDDRYVAETNGRSHGWDSYAGTPVNKTAELDDDMRYFIGRWLGDGSTTCRKGKRNPSILQIVFNATTEKEAAKRIAAIGEKAFGFAPQFRQTKQNTIAVRWENPIITSWFRGEFGFGCDGKHLPKKYDGDMQIALGLLDSDGMIKSHGAVSITLKNPGLIKWLRDTLFANGINACDATPTCHNNTMRFDVMAGQSREYLCPNMSKTYYDNREGIKHSPECAKWIRLSAVEIVENQHTTVYNLSVEENHQYNVNGVICHNCYILPTPEDNIESIFETAKRIARISSYGGGTGVDISRLRPKGAKVNNSAMTSTGAVSFLNLFDVTGSTIGQQGRRAALMVGLSCDHPDIEEFLHVKQRDEKLSSMNISIKFTDEFMEAVRDGKEFTLKFDAPNEHIEKSVDARKFFKEFCETQWDYGDPGALFIDRVRNFNLLSGYPEYNIDITNPCVTGDTLILTCNGYKRIKDIAGTTARIWNGFQWSNVEPRITGHNQKMLRITMSNGMSLDCTRYHKFILADDSRVEADKLTVGTKLHKWNYPVIGDVNKHDFVNYVAYTNGFYSGDGTSNVNEIVLYGEKQDVAPYLCVDHLLPYEGKTKAILSITPDGKGYVPGVDKNIAYRLDWLAGLIDSDGCCNDVGGSIAISSVDNEFISKVQLMLSTMGCASSFSMMHAENDRMMPKNDGSGELAAYHCQDCYRLVISAWNVKKLVDIGLKLHRVKVNPTPDRDAGRFIVVTAIDEIPDEETVYCFSEPVNHSGIFNGIMTAQCAEYPGNGGNSCNLGSINLYNVIIDKFTDKARIDFDKLADTVDTAVRMLDEILDYGYEMQPLDLNRQCISDWRSIGLGVFGLADALVALGIRYGTPKSRLLIADIMDRIIARALETSAYLAKEKGTFKKYDWNKTKKSQLIKMFINEPLYNLIEEYGLRNGSLISVAPTGTISLFAGGFTGGVEPMYQVSYERTTHSTEDAGKKFTVYARGVRDLLDFHGLHGMTTEQIKARFPFVVESHEIAPLDRVAMQGIMQDYVDCAISSTVNLPNSATPQDIYDIYMEAWKQGCKGITVFRDGCKRGNILGVKETSPTYNTIEPAKRRDTQRVDGSTFKQSSSCVPSMYVTVNKAESGDIFEVFTNASGGCQANISTITRLISLALRSGIKVDKVIEELRENRCPACQMLRKQGKNVSLSCGNAIADAIQAMLGTQHTIELVDGNTCPECGKATLKPEGNCICCANCGWSKCE